MGFLKGGWVRDCSASDAHTVVIHWSENGLADLQLAACDWWHGVPQLFWEFFFVPTGIPSSCAQVELVPVAV